VLGRWKMLTYFSPKETSKMNSFVKIIKGDYLQRTRSYAFLVTLAISLYIAYTFVPAPDAAYTTVRVGNYVGDYNSAWIGHVTAIMTSVFLSMIGFFLVNNSVKKDIETEVGMIIATTRVSNFKYLFSKLISNFLVLVSIMGLVLAMSIAIFFFRSKGFPFEISQFVLPYMFVAMPSLFLISSLAIAGEVFFGNKSVIQYIAFFVLFNVVMANVQMQKGSDELAMIDPFGIKVVTQGLERFVKEHQGEEVRIASMGFNFSEKRDIKTFVFEGMKWPIGFLFSRILWIGFAFTLVFVSSKFFHRFDVKEKIKTKKRTNMHQELSEFKSHEELKLSSLPPIKVDYGIFSFIKIEFLMLLRKGPRWFWIINLGGMVALTFAPIEVAHQFILPILWFLQIGRWSDLITKEKTNRIHYFTFAAYQPLLRLLPSQIIAGIILAITLATPLLLRYAFSQQFIPFSGVILGAYFIVLLSAFLGILSGGKKLFEVLFFMITYANLNRIPFADYFGSTWQSSQPIIILTAGIIFFAITSWMVRRYEIKHA
jgi:hypothetical protein